MNQRTVLETMVTSEFRRRLVRASPTERYMRLTPFVGFALLLFAVGIVMVSLETRRWPRFSWPLIVLAILVWVDLSRNVYRARRGQPVGGWIVWPIEWFMGIFSTSVIAISLYNAFVRSAYRPRYHSTHALTHPVAHPLSHSFGWQCVALTIAIGLFVFLCRWWVCVLGDFCRPSSTSVAREMW